MSAIVADTHAVVWYLLEPSRLSRAAEAAFDRATQAGAPILIASISLVELRYLVEKGRVAPTALARVEAQLLSPVQTIHLVPLDLTICNSIQHIPRDEVPDMPDRIIAATAHALKLPLVSRDRKIRSSAIPTIW